MAGSRRKHKRFRAKVRVGLPKRNPHVFKPAFTIPDALDDPSRRWDDEGSVITNYKAFGVVSNPNLLGVRNRTSHVVQLPSLQLPAAQVGAPVDEFDPIDSGSDLETDDLKSALGKRRRDGRHAPPQPLTKMQRVHVGRMVEKYRDDYQAMFMDTKLNALQHSVGMLKKLCQRYHLTGPNVSRFKIRKGIICNGEGDAATSTGGVEVVP